MINMIYAYAYVALYYNGDYLDCAEDAVNIFLTICMNMKDNKVFNDAESAIQSIMDNVKSVSLYIHYTLTRILYIAYYNKIYIHIFI